MALPGRKRNAPITLARIGIAPANEGHMGPRHGERAGPHPGEIAPYRPHAVTEADDFAQMREAFAGYFTALEAVAPRRVALAIQADPLELRSGGYAKRPKTHPAQPTPERVLRGREAGEVLGREQWLNDRGEAVGEPKTEMTPALKSLLARGTIDDNEYEAATRLCKHWYFSQFGGPATSQYRERVDGGGGELSLAVQERRVYYRQRFYDAVRSVHGLLAPAVAWTLSTMGDPKPLSAMGAYYVPGKSESTRSARAAAMLQITLAMLCEHYGISHRLTAAAQQKVMGELVALID